MVDNRRRYRVIETLGQGGFGTVYRAEMLGQGGFAKQVALKLLNKGVDEDEVTTRFRDEARILGLIDHRAVVKVDSLTQLQQGWAVVMEYVHGVNVSALVKAQTPPSCALEIAEEVASALHAAYAMPSGMTGEPLGLIHRDVKPANIRVTPQGTVKVLDFGVARAEFQEREAQTVQMRFGSLRYMAPERLDSVESHQGDIFALGLVLAELLGGRRYPEPPKSERRFAPFYDGVLDYVRQNLSEGTWKVEDEGLRNRIVELVGRCLRFDHDERPTAKEVERSCRDLAQQIGGPRLRDWCEEVVPGLMRARQIDQVPTDSVLVEFTASQALVGLDTSSRLDRTSTTVIGGLALGGALVVGLGVLAVVVLGGGAFLGWTWSGTPVAADAPQAVVVPPALTLHEVDVDLQLPGATPADVEGALVPVEDALADLEGLVELDTTAVVGAGRVVVRVLTEAQVPDLVATIEQALVQVDGLPAIQVSPHDPAALVPVPAAEPEPEPEPAPQPAVAPTRPSPKRPAGARVTQGGDATKVVLTGPSGSFTLRGSARTVPAGAYDVLATFGDAEPFVAGKVQLQLNESATISCQSMLMICSKR